MKGFTLASVLSWPSLMALAGATTLDTPQGYAVLHQRIKIVSKQVSAADGSNRPAPRRALDDSDALPGSDSDYGLEATLSQRQDYPETLPEQYYAKWDYFSALPGYDVYSEEDIRWVQEQEHSAVLARLQADILDLSNKFFISDKTLVVVGECDPVTSTSQTEHCTIDGGGKTKLFTIDIQSQLVLYMLHLVRGYSSSSGGALDIWSQGQFKYEGSAFLLDVAFKQNTANVAGGAIYVAGNATLISCTFAGNTASYKASGDIYVDTSGAAQARLALCTARPSRRTPPKTHIQAPAT
ncbi:hypothetical protein CYMTET_23865, partial [Cymbomonas tetramitiformis]